MSRTHHCRRARPGSHTERGCGTPGGSKATWPGWRTGSLRAARFRALWRWGHRLHEGLAPPIGRSAALGQGCRRSGRVSAKAQPQG